MIKQLDVSYFEAIYEIMEEAFPYEERRTKEGQYALFSLPCYEVYGWIEQEALCAILCVWKLHGFYFGEHLATTKKLRNHQIGKQLFQSFEASCKLPIVFEVELPENEMAQRRIGFYERMGYHYYGEIPYYQGSFHQETKKLPLRLMMKEADLDKTVIVNRVDQIYEHVYQRKRWFDL